MDQGSLFQQYDFNVNWFEAPNPSLIRTQLSVFLCPSTPGSNRLDTNLITVGGVSFSGPRACADYAPLEGVGSLLTGTGPVERPAGTRACNWALLTNVTSATRLPNITIVFGSNRAPLIVTMFPPSRGPEAGETALIEKSADADERRCPSVREP